MLDPDGTGAMKANNSSGGKIPTCRTRLEIRRKRRRAAGQAVLMAARESMNRAC